jgi:hypothetical protein
LHGKEKPMEAMMKLDNLVDATLVLGVLLLIAGGGAALTFVHIPQENLAILASLLSGTGGTVIGGYAGYRWGASTNKGGNVQQHGDGQ